MTFARTDSPPARRADWAAILFRAFYGRQPVLACYAALCLLFGAATLVGSGIDPRTINGVSVWLKPSKFFLSLGIFIGTTTWFFGYLRADRRHRLPARAVVLALLIAATFELAWITWQGAHGQGSHFNFSTPLTRTMYAMMGVGAVVIVATCLPLAWEIARHPNRAIDDTLRLSVILGLVLTFALGGASGGLISAAGGSSVGVHSSGLPLVAWNQIGGDLRVAHFFGIHAQQALPLVGFALGLTRLKHPKRAVILSALIYTVVTMLLLLQARAGIPLISQ